MELAMENDPWQTIFGTAWIILVIVSSAVCLGVWFWKSGKQFRNNG